MANLNEQSNWTIPQDTKTNSFLTGNLEVLINDKNQYHSIIGSVNKSSLITNYYNYSLFKYLSFDSDLSDSVFKQLLSKDYEAGFHNFYSDEFSENCKFFSPIWINNYENFPTHFILYKNDKIFKIYYLYPLKVKLLTYYVDKYFQKCRIQTYIENDTSINIEGFNYKYGTIEQRNFDKNGFTLNNANIAEKFREYGLLSTKLHNLSFIFNDDLSDRNLYSGEYVSLINPLDINSKEISDDNLRVYIDTKITTSNKKYAITDKKQLNYFVKDYLTSQNDNSYLNLYEPISEENITGYELFDTDIPAYSLPEEISKKCINNIKFTIYKDNKKNAKLFKPGDYISISSTSMDNRTREVRFTAVMDDNPSPSNVKNNTLIFRGNTSFTVSGSDIKIKIICNELYEMEEGDYITIKGTSNKVKIINLNYDIQNKLTSFEFIDYGRKIYPSTPSATLDFVYKNDEYLEYYFNCSVGVYKTLENLKKSIQNSNQHFSCTEIFPNKICITENNCKFTYELIIYIKNTIGIKSNNFIYSFNKSSKLNTYLINDYTINGDIIPFGTNENYYTINRNSIGIIGFKNSPYSKFYTNNEEIDVSKQFRSILGYCDLNTYQFENIKKGKSNLVYLNEKNEIVYDNEKNVFEIITNNIDRLSVKNTSKKISTNFPFQLKLYEISVVDLKTI